MKYIIIIVSLNLLTGILASAQTSTEENKSQAQEPQTVLDQQAPETVVASTVRTRPAKFKTLPAATQATLDKEFPGCLILSSEIFDSNDRSGSGSASYGIKILYGDERYSVEISPEGKMISRLRQYTSY